MKQIYKSTETDKKGNINPNVQENIANTKTTIPTPCNSGKNFKKGM